MKKTQYDTWKYVGWAFAGGVVIGIPFAILAWLTGIKMLTPLGATGGAVLFMMNRIYNDRKSQ